jgi:hypothetical protein
MRSSGYHPIILFEASEEEGKRKLHNGELHNLYYSPNIMRMVKSITVRGAGHVASMRRGGMLRGFDGKIRRKETTSRT